MCLVESIESDAIVVFADEALKPPFEVSGSGPPLAVAFCLGKESSGALAQISFWRGEGTGLPFDEHFGFLHVSAAIPLLERLVNRIPGRVALEFEAGQTGEIWMSEVEPLGV